MADWFQVTNQKNNVQRKQLSEEVEKNAKKREQPKMRVQIFTPNEYVSACGILEDGTVLYGDNITIETAFERIPAGIDRYIQDDILETLT